MDPQAPNRRFCNRAGGIPRLTLRRSIASFRRTNGTGSTSNSGGRRSRRRRGLLSILKRNFDNNPRLATVVGFLLISTVAAKKQKPRLERDEQHEHKN